MMPSPQLVSCLAGAGLVSSDPHCWDASWEQDTVFGTSPAPATLLILPLNTPAVVWGLFSLFPPSFSPMFAMRWHSY